MILSYIRKNQCKRLFYPLMLLGVVIFLVWRSPVTEYVTKRTISNAVLINDSMAKRFYMRKLKRGLSITAARTVLLAVSSSDIITTSLQAEAVIFISSALRPAIQLPKHLKDRLLQDALMLLNPKFQIRSHKSLPKIFHGMPNPLKAFARNILSTRLPI